MPSDNATSRLRLENGIDSSELLSKALRNLGKEMALTLAEIGRVIGKDRSAISRGIDPSSKAGELSLLLIRCYRSIHVLVGGDTANIQHWMHTENLHTGGIPAEQVQTVSGLMRILEYLDAMRGKS